MSNDTKISLHTPQKAASEQKTSKRSLSLKLLNFIAWVIVIGLLLSPLFFTVQQSEVIHEQR